MSDPAIDAAFGARATVSPAEFERVMTAYRDRSAEAVRTLSGTADIAFDPGSDERLDVWGTGPHLRPVVIALHGGYWRMLSRHDTAFMAGVLAEAGIATVVPDYTLAPAATLEEIVRQVRAAVAWVWREGPLYGLDHSRIHLVGSSAGGHLAAMAAVAGWQGGVGLPDDVVRGFLGLSGLYDVRPLVDSFANEWLALDRPRAAALSPLLATPSTARAIVAEAEHEASGFHEVADAFAAHWSPRAPSRRLVVPDRHHFDVFLDLAEPDSVLSRALIDLVLGQP
ncbi:alpha/beta hydrolase [Nocardioides sp.]|uniref:alpha/beta hydrolase n=1 Tax=Nocardioides sp. TaxID=35761 RepID=UPI0026190F65|nr:alpha/beta hydrolase [Nocardioides sp.]